MIKQVVITDAWLEHDGKFSLNPALATWQKKLLCMKQQWNEDQMQVTPLSWFAWHHWWGNAGPAALLATLVTDIPVKSKQFWVVSPYHARLTRSVLRVMPESLLDLSAENAAQIRELINPLLVEHGMSLHVVGSCLLLACDRVWDVTIEDFAHVSGHVLPNSLPAGKDAKAWLRLLTEIQMTLQMQPVSTPQGLHIHGLWPWDAEPEAKDIDLEEIEPIATCNPYLKSVLQVLDKERDASIIVTEADHLPDLLNTNTPLPRIWLLLGAGKSVKLTPSVFKKGLAKVRAQQWKGI